MVNYHLLAQDRLDTDMGEYDMITAVTQRAVNEQLRRLWADTTNNLKHMKVDVNGETVITSDMDPPRVHFQLGTKNLRVAFFLEFTSGIFNYLKRGAAVAEVIRLDKCTLAFDVDMSMQILTNPSTDSRLVRALRAHGLGEPGNYHVMQLIIDFTTANLMNYREDWSHLPPLTATTSGRRSGELAAMLTDFTNWIKQYLKGIKLSTDSGGSPHSIYDIPRFVKPLATPRHPAATLAPTALTFQCYPYLASDDDDFDETLEDNMLLYLEMTKHAKLPRKSLDTSKNWKIFLEDWLLVHLEVLNKATWISATASNIPTEHTVGSWHFSNDNDPNVDYRFLPYEEEAGGASYWEFNEGSTDAAANDTVSIKVNTSIKNRVDVKPGSSQVIITGHSDADSWFQYKSNQKGSKFWATMDWTITITLDADSNGQLKVTVTTPDPLLDKGRDELPAGGNDIRIWDGEKYDPHYSIQGKLSKDTLTDLEGRLNTMFQSTWPFFFAGNQVFTFSGAVFNNNLDLLLDLRYQ
ncbi:hypothetical protein FB451DRAFT_1460663 [Mycena latifolia]|nr:hypothetical protein FB451DRAFT_1460663 [Mycena latifolia]